MMRTACTRRAHIPPRSAFSTDTQTKLWSVEDTLAEKLWDVKANIKNTLQSMLTTGNLTAMFLDTQRKKKKKKNPDSL